MDRDKPILAAFLIELISCLYHCHQKALVFLFEIVGYVVSGVQGGPEKTCHFTFVHIFANY